tara:strand:+ start:23257 stop:24171 length:915 start_codon:yes stop_codon:yes gene_type:complete
MLQQTRVSTVLPYFERWMEAFPGFAALAAADPEEVVNLWQGLGYYSRARNLHKLAQRIAAEGVPSSVADWLKLPGIGGYTSAAIASIAQELPVAVVDGNVVRVLARLSANETRWKSAGEAVKSFGALAEDFLNAEQPGEHNEAMMELGALVCLPRAPLCTVCPLVRHCDAAAKGIAQELPVIVKARKNEVTVRRALVVEAGRVLLLQHPKNAKRLAGIHELPSLEDLPQGWVPETSPLAKRKRGIGNDSITEWIHSVANLSTLPKECPLKWIDIQELESVSISGPHRRWIGELKDQLSCPRPSV